MIKVIFFIELSLPFKNIAFKILVNTTNGGEGDVKELPRKLFLNVAENAKRVWPDAFWNWIVPITRLINLKKTREDHFHGSSQSCNQQFSFYFHLIAILY